MSLNTTDKGDIIALGSPQLGINKLELISKNIDGTNSQNLA